MYIRLYSSNSRPREVTECRSKKGKFCTEVRTFACFKHIRFFRVEYLKENEKNYSETDNRWHFCVWLENKTESEPIRVGHTYWVSEDLESEPIEYKIENVYDLKELRAYILKNCCELTPP